MQRDRVGAVTPAEWAELDEAEREYARIDAIAQTSHWPWKKNGPTSSQYESSFDTLSALLLAHARQLINAARPKCGYCHGHGLKPMFLKGTGELIYVAGRPCEHCQPRPPEPTGEDETEALREMLAALDTDSPTDAA